MWWINSGSRAAPLVGSTGQRPWWGPEAAPQLAVHCKKSLSNPLIHCNHIIFEWVCSKHVNFIQHLNKNIICFKRYWYVHLSISEILLNTAVCLNAHGCVQLYHARNTLRHGCMLLAHNSVPCLIDRHGCIKYRHGCICLHSYRYSISG